MDATAPSLAAAPAGSTPLAAPDIERALSLAWPGDVGVEAIAITGSTNEDLVAGARARQPPRCLLRAADFQTGGRGRQKRQWHAAPGDALLFSVAIPITDVPAHLPAVTLACGVALTDVLDERGVEVQLKWPNDVRVNGRKLAGILTELVTDRDARNTLVIGVGMNLHLDDAARCMIEQPAIALDELLEPVPREEWIGRFGGATIAATAQFVHDGFDPFCARFNRRLEARGAMVDVVDGDQRVISGRVVEVDRFGRLVIDSGGVSRSISVGDVTVPADNR